MMHEPALMFMEGDKSAYSSEDVCPHGLLAHLL